MRTYVYMPQLMVAYDRRSDDQFANLIHVMYAIPGNDYYCPCCGQVVHAIGVKNNTGAVQPHYRHMGTECSNESRIHWFIKNWLFEDGSKFYINEELYEVKEVQIEQSHETPFGIYKPDITVLTTCGKTIYFEMYFQNRKTESDYFCKWDYLKNDIVEINVKEYFMKTNKEDIPVFHYMYHDGECFCKEYNKRDIYMNIIGRMKQSYTREQLIEHKRQLELLDSFWIGVQNCKTKDELIALVDQMDVERKIVCYNLASKKQCIKYLTGLILDSINKEICEKIKELIGFEEEGIFDLELNNRTLRTSTICITGEKSGVEYKKDLDNGYKITFKSKFHTWEEVEEKINFDDLKKEVPKVKELVNSYLDKIIEFRDKCKDLEIPNAKYSIDGEMVKAVVLVDEKYIPIESFYHNYDIDYFVNKINEKRKRIIKKREQLKELNQIFNSEYFTNAKKELMEYAGKYELKISIELVHNVYDEVVVEVYIEGRHKNRYRVEDAWVIAVKKDILHAYKERESYSYYCNLLNDSGMFSATLFYGKYNDVGVKIKQLIDRTYDVKPYILYIRKNDYLASIEMKFKHALAQLYTDLENTGDIGFYGEF